MQVEIREAKTRKEIKSFIRFPFSLYKGNPYYVPPIISFELSTLLATKNPAFDHCEAVYYLAYRDSQIVGRIAGIIHEKEKAEKKRMRFGWIDFIDDHVVSEQLISHVLRWGRTKGITSLHGPMGFTDLDFEGMLVEGFDKMGTQATIYNFPYYNDHLKKLGFVKSVDWLEGTAQVPKEVPKRLMRSISVIKNRFGLKVVDFKRNKDMLKYGRGVFETLNKSFGNLYGFYKLTDKQIQYYIDQYFGFIRKEFVTIVINEQDNVVAFAITLPSLSRAFQKARGSLFPFGFIPVLGALRKNEIVDMLLIGIDPDYQKLGASQLIFVELIDNYIKNGVKQANSAIMLEENMKVLNLFNEESYFWKFDVRRRCYIKSLES